MYNQLMSLETSEPKITVCQNDSEHKNNQKFEALQERVHWVLHNSSIGTKIRITAFNSDIRELLLTAMLHGRVHMVKELMELGQVSALDMMRTLCLTMANSKQLIDLSFYKQIDAYYKAGQYASPEDYWKDYWDSFLPRTQEQVALTPREKIKIAIEKNLTEVMGALIKDLLRIGVDLKEILMMAIQSNRVDVIKLLIAQGMDVKTVLKCLLKQNRIDLIKELIGNGIEKRELEQMIATSKGLTKELIDILFMTLMDSPEWKKRLKKGAKDSAKTRKKSRNRGTGTERD